MRSNYLGSIIATVFGLGWLALGLAAEDSQTLLAKSKESLDKGQFDQALKWLDQVEKQEAAGSEQRIEARAFGFIVRAKFGEFDIHRGVDVIRESSALLNKNRSLYDEVQFSVINTLVNSDAFSKREKNTKGNILKRKFSDLISEIERRMIDQGISTGIAKLALFGHVQSALELQEFSSAQLVLEQIRPAIDSPLISIQWKAMFWNKFAEVHLQHRHFAVTLDACHRFEAMARQSQDPAAIAVSQDLLALVYLRMGDYANAKQLLEASRSFQLNNPFLDQAMAWRTNMAKALEGEREFLLARQYLLDGQGILDGNSDSPSLLKGLVMNNLGLNYYLTGELQEARKLFESSRRHLTAKGMTRTLFAAEATINQGWLELASQRPETAAQYFDEASRLIANIASENHVRFAESLAAASRAYLAIGDRIGAAKRIRRAEQLAYESLLHDLQAIVDPRDRIAIVQEARVHPENIVWPGVFDTFLEMAAPLDIPASEQLEVVLRWKGILNRLQNSAQRKIHFQRIDEVRLLEQELSEIYFRPGSISHRKEWGQEIALIEKKLREVRHGLSAPPSISTLHEAEKPISRLNSIPVDSGVLSIVQIRKYRPPSNDEEVGTSGEFLGFVAVGDKIARVSLGDARQLESGVVAWRNSITTQFADERILAQRIANLVQNPLLPLIPGIRRLIIDPDGVCHTLPWCALPGLSTDEYWIDDLAIEYSYDLSLAERPRGDQTNPSLLVVGDIDYGPLSKALQPLPFASREIHDIQRIFIESFPNSSVELLDSDLPDKLSVTRKLSGRSIVHLTTHGFYKKREGNDAFALIDATSLLETGLFLAAPKTASPADKTPASQILTASDVMAMELDSLELVVLSSCETGVGNQKAGQGMDSLVSSFHAAGAHQTVSTLWKVRDAATAELMRIFYKNLWIEKFSVTDALRNAQRELIRTHPEWKHPSNWAAFSGCKS